MEYPIAPSRVRRAALLSWACIAVVGYLCAIGVRTSSAENGVWSSPDVRAEATARVLVHDPVRNRIIAFGGRNNLGDLNDVWAFSGGQWTRLDPTGEPPTGGTDKHFAFYDPRRDEVLVVHIGIHAGARIWALSLSGTPAWRRVGITSAGPPFYLSSISYDPGSDRLISFGGWYATTLLTYRDELWVFDLQSGVWTKLAPPARPPARSGSVTTFAPSSNTLIVHGGVDAYETFYDTWSYSFSTNTWTEVTPPARPYGGVSGGAIYWDSRRERAVVLGQPLDGLWSPTPGSPWTWTKIPSVSRPFVGTGERSIAYDSTADRVLMLGLTGLWSLSSPDSVWRLIRGPDRAIPLAMCLAASAYDPVGRRMVVFKGEGLFRFDHLGALDLEPPMLWSFGPAGESAPDFEHGQLLLHDPLRDELVRFGEQTQLRLSPRGADVWTRIPTAGSRPTIDDNEYQYGAFTDLNSGIYDPVRDRFVLTTVRDQPSGLGLNEVWEVTLDDSARWTLLQANIPRQNVLSTGHAVYDAKRDRMLALVLTRFDNGPTNLDTLQVWALPLSGVPTWYPVSPKAPFSSQRLGTTVMLDPIRDRLVIAGGLQPGYSDPDSLWTWGLSLEEPPIWSRIYPAGKVPVGRGFAVSTYDPIGDQLVTYGGSRTLSNPPSRVLGDTWLLTWGASSAAIVGPSADTTYTPSMTQEVRFPVTNRGPGSRTYGYALNDERHWPGLARTGTFVTAPGTQMLSLDVAAPDTALYGTNQLLLRVYPVEYPGLVTTASVALRSTATSAVSATLVLAEADSGGVTLEWRVEGGVAPEADVERAEGASGWSVVAHLVPGPDGIAAFVDHDVLPGGHYRYRLTTHDLTGDRTYEEIAIEVPVGPLARFALAGARPNPTTASLAIVFSLPDAAPAMLDLLDLSGRQLRRVEVGAMGPGPHSVQLGVGLGLRSGIYFVRLTRGAQRATTRVVLIE